MSKNPTQTELLQKIVELLTPMSNLAQYQVGQVNKQIQSNAIAAKKNELYTQFVESQKPADENAEG